MNGYLLQGFHWNNFMFLSASDLRDYAGKNRSAEKNGSIWWNSETTFFFFIIDCQCCLTNMTKCSSSTSQRAIEEVNYNDWITKESGPGVVIGDTSVSDNGVHPLMRFQYLCWHRLAMRHVYVPRNARHNERHCTASNSDAGTFKLLIIRKDKSLSEVATVT